MLRRRLFTFCSACSLLLCVAVCGLWAIKPEDGARPLELARYSWHERSWAVERTTVGLRATDRPQRLADFQRLQAAVEPLQRSQERNLSRRLALMELPYAQRDLREMARLDAEFHTDDATLSDLIAAQGVALGSPLTALTGEYPGAVTLSYATAACSTGILPFFWAVCSAQRYAMKRRRQRRGRCRACGYDLRATPGLCPECGAASAEGQVSL